ncbi:hypothetical protein E2C01_066135 [Portunus trituberculatus]|uniref:Uncharacterized protein n=1 Tax=Portunus trituberculatus TaxID=210409 RepID=A0A5B7HQ88_PORTR|nr:hypothetical protein [Portunus trituberculatus]
MSVVAHFTTTTQHHTIKKNLLLQLLLRAAAASLLLVAAVRGTEEQTKVAVANDEPQNGYLATKEAEKEYQTANSEGRTAYANPAPGDDEYGKDITIYVKKDDGKEHNHKLVYEIHGYDPSGE